MGLFRHRCKTRPTDRPTDRSIAATVRERVALFGQKPTDRPTATGATVRERVAHFLGQHKIDDSYNHPAVLVLRLSYYMARALYSTSQKTGGTYSRPECGAAKEHRTYVRTTHTGNTQTLRNTRTPVRDTLVTRLLPPPFARTSPS